MTLEPGYETDKASVLTRKGPTDLFEFGIIVEQGCPASPLLFNTYLDSLESKLDETAMDIDRPETTAVRLAILLFAMYAVDVALKAALTSYHNRRPGAYEDDARGRVWAIFTQHETAVTSCQIPVAF